MIVWHYCTRYAIGGILHDGCIDKRKNPKATPAHEHYNWFTDSPYPEFGAAYGALFEPMDAPLSERIKIFGNMLDNRKYAFRMRLELFDAVIRSGPFRIGVDSEKIAWDYIDEDEHLSWFGVRRPIPLNEWVSFERLTNGTRDRDSVEVSGTWSSMPIPELMRLVNVHGSRLKATDPPWKHYYKNFIEVHE